MALHFLGVLRTHRWLTVGQENDKKIQLKPLSIEHLF